MWNSNRIAQTSTEAKINRLNKIENHLFYNQECDPQILLSLYQQVWQQQEIIATGSKAEHELLKSGLVVLYQHKIRLDPALDRDSFNDSWIENQLMRLRPYSKIRLKLFDLDLKASLPYKVLTEVNAWTDGHPFLSQKIYQIIRDRQSFIPRNQEVAKISQLVHLYIIDDWEKGIAATHLRQLKSQMLAYSGSSEYLLLSYQAIWHSQSTFFDQTPEQEFLLRIGLIKLKKDLVQIANRIYRDVFNHVWVKNKLTQTVGLTNHNENSNSANLFLQQISNDVKSNFSRLAKIITCLLVIGGITGGSFYLIAKYFQLQQLDQAKNLLKQKKYAAAITVYDRLLQADRGRSHLLWINRGAAWSGLKQYDQMLQSCSTATLIKPKASMGWNCRGEALYYLDRPEAAQKAFEQAIAINPEEATFWLNQSQVLARLQQHSQAIAASEQAIKLLLQSPSEATNRRNLAIAFNQKGQSWLKLNQNQPALSAFEQSLEYSPDYLSALQGQAIAQYRLGHYTEAITAFAEILQHDNLTQEQQAINLLYKGISLCETPEATAAPQAFKQVLKLTTDRQAKAIAQAGCGIR